MLIKDYIQRGNWRFGILVKLQVSNEGQVRSANVKTSSGRMIGRPLSPLYPIEITKEVSKLYISK